MKYKIVYRWRVGCIVVYETTHARSARHLKWKKFWIRFFGNTVWKVTEL